MTPEERKAIAMRHDAPSSTLCQRHYPGCCSYHEGFDDALGLLVPSGFLRTKPGLKNMVGVVFRTSLGDEEPVYVIEAANG